jgi:hypothetical protein
VRVDLQWRDNSDNEVGFAIERQTIPGGSWVVIWEHEADISTYADTTVLGETSYQYRVRALGETQDSGPSNVVGVVTPELTPPNAPTNLGAEAVASGWVDLSWWDNSDNEAGFKIMRRAEGGIYRQVATVDMEVTEYSDVGLTESTTYFYQVRAFNDAGHSAFSNEASATTFDPTYHIWGGVAAGKEAQVSIGQVSKTDRCTQFITSEGYVAPLGHYFAVLPVSVTNTGLTPFDVSPHEFTLRDTTYLEVFGMHRCPRSDKGAPFGETVVNAGRTFTGVIFFVVPKSVELSGLEAVYHLEGSVHIWPRTE